MDFNRICLRCMRGSINETGVCSVCKKPPLVKQEPECALPLQTIIHGRYVIGGVLGQGGFGITYAAYDLKENRRVVIKEFFPAFMVRRLPGSIQVTVTKDQNYFLKYRTRFVQEAQTIYTFNNTPEIVDVYHIFIENGTGYYTMEFLEGLTLQKVFRANGNRLSWDQLTPIVSDMINALRVVHGNGGIHRDISPDNIFLTTSGKAKLIDFGAARNFHTDKEMTQILKKGFAPIEQYRKNGKFGPWTDIYALAATIYYCLTGRMVPEATQRAMRETLQRPEAYGATIPEHTSQALMYALNIHEEDRFQNVDAFARALQLGYTAFPSGPVRDVTRSTSQETFHSGGHWQLRCIHGLYIGKTIPFSTSISIGRDPSKCQIVFPQNAPGVSAVHLTLLNGRGPSFPGIRCESASQQIFINGNVLQGRGNFEKVQNGDRITFGDNQIFIVEKVV